MDRATRIVDEFQKAKDIFLQDAEDLGGKALANIIPFSPHTFMILVGLIEIVAGIGVLFTPWTRLFAWIVAIWLWGIALNLVIAGYYDIAVRDIVMGISAAVLARLTVMVPAEMVVKFENSDPNWPPVKLSVPVTVAGVLPVKSKRLKK